jgi:hypothetical protein
MTEQPDTTTLSGAEFQRHAGTDAQKWAGACYAAMRAPGVYGDSLDGPGRVAFLARWFSDYAEVRVAEELGRVTARLVPRHDD